VALPFVGIESGLGEQHIWRIHPRALCTAQQPEFN
jgi:hypothetical protein